MIKRLVIQDCLGIEELAINPGKVNLITGGNEKGKTSILEVIEKALCNTQRRAKFVRVGAEKAYIELETDDGIKIARTITDADKGNKIKVTQKGLPKGTPEAFLKDLVGVGARRRESAFGFSPVDFMLRNEKDQTDILLSLLPISITKEQVTAWFGNRFPEHMSIDKHGLILLKELEIYFYNARREANSRLEAVTDEAAAVALRLPDNYDAQKWAAVNLSEAYGKIAKAQEANEAIARANALLEVVPERRAGIKNKYEVQRKEVADLSAFRKSRAAKEVEEKKEEIRQEISRIDTQIDDLKEKILTLQGLKAMETAKLEAMDNTVIASRHEAADREAAAKLEAIAENEKRELAELEDIETAARTASLNPISDTKEIEAFAQEAELMKSYLPLAHEVESILKRKQEASKEASLLNTLVHVCRTKPAELLADIELPVKGLGFNDEGLTIDGLPIKNLSTSRQVRLCLDIAKAVAKDNVLKLICVDKLETLDTEARAAFMAQIEADDTFQYFVTEVTSGDLNIEVKK